MSLLHVQEEEVGSIKDCWDSREAPALSTCSNASIFRRINAILDNSLDFSRVCTTPVNPRIRDRLPGDLELELGMY
jgi:cytoplasmic polyadenylation element-binding protein